MGCSCPLAKKPTPPELPELLRAALDRRPGAESLNALAKRLGLRKSYLIQHRDDCLGLRGAEREDPETVAHPTVDDGPASVPGDVPPSVPPPPESAPPAVALARPPDGAESSAEPPVQVVQDSGGRVVRALPPHADVESRFQARALEVADLMSRGRWDRKQARELAARWGITRQGIHEYAQAASVALAADRGQLEQQREVSVAYALARRDAARKNHKRALEACADAQRTAAETDDETARAIALQAEGKHARGAAEWAKLELNWHEHADRVAGTLTAQAPSMTVNVLSVASGPVFEGLMGVVLGALADEPAAREKVVAAVRAEIEARRGRGR